MSRVSRVGLGWTAPERIDWYANVEDWYNAERLIDYGSVMEAICKGDCTKLAGTDLLIDAPHGAWIYADPSVYYDYTNESVIPFIDVYTVIRALDVRVSGIFLKTTLASNSTVALTVGNVRPLIEDCRIKQMNPTASGAYALRIDGAGSLANAGLVERCVISRANAAITVELVKQAQASGFGVIRNCVLDSGAGKYADGSNNVGFEVSDCVGLGSAGYDATSLVLNTSSSEDASGSSGLTSIDNTALADYANDDFRSSAGGPLDVTGTNTAFIGVGLDAVAGDAITLTPFSSTARYIFNREIDGSDRTIDVSISLTGDPSGGIQWRLIDEATNLPISGFDWSTFLASPAIGAHTVPVDVPTSTGKIWYKLQLRFTLDTGINVESGLEFAVGVIVVDNGQSNSQYRDSLTSSPPIIDPDAAYCTTAGWQTSFSTGNGAIAKANALVTLLNVPVGYYNNGLISQALPYFVTGTGWDDLTGIMANHFDNYFELMSFDQGETDARTAVTTATYQTNCQTLLDNILTQMARPASEFNFAMCLGGNSDGYNSGTYTDSSLEEIRDAKRNFAVANSGVTLGHRIDFPLSDSIHHSPATYELIAAREIGEYEVHLGLASSNNREITSAILLGDELTVNYSSGVVFTKVGTGGSTMTQVSDDSFSTFIAITATTVNDDNVVHTLASTPVTDVKVRDYFGIDIDVSTRPNLVAATNIESTSVPVVPTVTLNPTNKSETEPTPFTLTSLATGSVSSQWYKDGSPVSGEIGNNLTVTPTTVADSGGYFNRFTNVTGDTDTTTATVTISALPTEPNKPNITAIAGNELINMSWSGSPTATGYRTYLDGVPTDVGLVTSHQYSGLTNDTSYEVYVVAYNAVGDSVDSNKLNRTPSLGIEIPIDERKTLGDVAVHLRLLGFTGCNNDVIVAWLKGEAVIGSQFNDLFNAYLDSKGYVGNYPDKYGKWRIGE